MRCVILQALLLAACGTMLVHGQQGTMGGGTEPMPYTATTTASSRSEFEGRWQHFHLNASRVQILSFDAIVGATGATAKFVIVGEGNKCSIMPPMSGSHPGSMPPPHPVSGSMAAGSHCVSMGPNDLSQMNAQEIDNVLLREARVVFQQLGVSALSHGSAWTWRLVNNGTTIVRPTATFEVSVTMTGTSLTSEINRVAGAEVVASAVCGNSTHTHRSGNAAITCEVEFVSSEAAVKAAVSGNANALMSVYSSTTEEGDISAATDGVAHVSVMLSVLCVCAAWAILQL